MLTLSSHAAIARPSPTLAITAKAKALAAAGADVIQFAAGEPDFNTPEPICEAAKAAIDRGFTKYTVTTGIVELKEAISKKLLGDNGLRYAPDQIVVTCGAKQALYNSLWILIEPGDEVIVFGPYWMTYADQIRLVGGVPVVVNTRADQNFVPSHEDLKRAVSPRTKAIMVNSPCNPTGAVYPRSTIKEIAHTALQNNLWVIADEIYEKLIYEGEHVSIGSLSEDLLARTITIGGCSKTFAMTGWRIGYLAGPKDFVKAVGAFQDQVTSNPTSFAQVGALSALQMDATSVEGMRAEFDVRRTIGHAELMKIPNLIAPKPCGAFYFFVDFSAYLGGQIKTDAELAEFLLEQVHVATIPGSVFEGPGFLRLSYTASQDNIRRGIQRIGEALARL
jgi:aspartate aminotransferase